LLENVFLGFYFFQLFFDDFHSKHNKTVNFLKLFKIKQNLAVFSIYLSNVLRIKVLRILQESNKNQTHLDITFHRQFMIFYRFPSSVTFFVVISFILLVLCFHLDALELSFGPKKEERKVLEFHNTKTSLIHSLILSSISFTLGA
jgi:uncharacterized membrane protein